MDIRDYEVWLHAITACVLLVLLLFYLWRFCVNSIANTADNSKYAYMIIKWILSKKNQEMTPEIQKKFISIEDMGKIERMQNFLNTVDKATIKKSKYKEMKHPFFVWHEALFCRTNGNDVVRVNDGKIGKIQDDEEVDEIIISTNFTKIITAIHFAVEMKKHFDKIDSKTK